MPLGFYGRRRSRSTSRSPVTQKVRQRLIEISWPWIFNNMQRSAVWKAIEKGLDLPALSIDLCDGERRQVEPIGEEDEGFARIEVAIGNTAQAVRVGKFRFRCGEQDALVAAQSRRFVDLARGGPRVARIVLGANDEGDLALMQ